ncbi:unnamed protein product, partial [Rotaria magnacalcarata]
MPKRKESTANIPESLDYDDVDDENNDLDDDISDDDYE